MSCEPIIGCVKEDSTFSLLARVHVDGAIWSQAAVSTIVYSAWDVADTGTPVVNASALVVATVVFDSLQTDGRWTEDSTGYNFRHTIAHTVFTTPGVYQIEHKVTLASGSVFFLGPWRINVEDVLTS